MNVSLILQIACEENRETDLAEDNNAKYLPDKSGKQQHLDKKY
jgi:hypothetical protein